MAGQITALRFQKQNRDRVNVLVDGQFAFALPAMEAARLHKGQYLSDEAIAEYQALDLRAKGYARALRFLARRPRSVAEVRQNLRRYRSRDGRSLSHAHIDWILGRLGQRGYVDDEAFTRYWIEQRARFKPVAPRALRYELRQKGIDEPTIERIVAQECDAHTACLAAARSRAARWRHLEREAFRAKMSGFLQRRGFDWDAIHAVVEQVWQEVQTAPASDE